MTLTWQSDVPPVLPPVTPWGWVRAGRRGLPIVLLIAVGLLALLALRLIERPLFGPRRPLTPWVTQGVCRGVLVLLGLRVQVQGLPQSGAGVVVANHVSWLDIFVLNAAARLLFVAKAEVAGWPGIGWLARATGTVFIRRDRADLPRQIAMFRARIAAGHRLMLFPEGTSTDGLRVLPFKPALFAAFIDPGYGDLTIQPVSLMYQAPPGGDPRFFGWFGGMDFAPHLLRVLARQGAGAVMVQFHPALSVAQFANRKALALACETAVRAGVTASRPVG